MEELLYTFVQVLHNLAAAALVGVSAAALVQRPDGRAERRGARLVVAAWSVQIASGAGFAAVSQGLKGQLPEVSGVALVALLTKIGCAVLGLALGALLLRRAARWSPRGRRRAWTGSLSAAVLALAAAAALRWYL